MRHNTFQMSVRQNLSARYADLDMLGETPLPRLQLKSDLIVSGPDTERKIAVSCCCNLSPRSAWASSGIVKPETDQVTEISIIFDWK